ncbi:MAG: hypothetical protein FWC45_03365 [Treponema sp.]|nr:hypothetical protein [Treponema sp.]
METKETGAAGKEAAQEKRTVVQEEKKGLQIRDILLIAILLAAGIVLKFFVGTVINFGMKPNFIIAMYCLAILLIKPRLIEAAIIGILAGAICQFFPGQPYLNFVSELFGAVAMCLLIRIPMEKIKLPVKTVVSTFLSTLVSGFTFIGLMYLLYYVRPNMIHGKPTALAIFLGIIFGTAIINAIIVQVLYIPLRLALKKSA